MLIIELGADEELLILALFEDTTIKVSAGSSFTNGSLESIGVFFNILLKASSSSLVTCSLVSSAVSIDTKEVSFFNGFACLLGFITKNVAIVHNKPVLIAIPVVEISLLTSDFKALVERQ